MRLFYHPDYNGHSLTFDTTRKATWVANSLVSRPIGGVEVIAPEPLTVEALSDVHDPVYVRAVATGAPKALAETSGFPWDPRVFRAVALSNGGAVAAALYALATGCHAGSLSSGMHHAGYASGGGFCTFNGVALAAHAALLAGARVLVLDTDAHCGGGTFEILSTLADVVSLDLSVNAFDGYKPEAPHTLDVVRMTSAYLPTLHRRLVAAGAAHGPFDLIVYNAGMDPHEASSVGGLPGVTAKVLADREALVFDFAEAHDIPVAFVLAGGYVSDDLTESALVDLHRLTIARAARTR
jgi:acetoin utilization deacetylase AcuC-like enzyme